MIYIASDHAGFEIRPALKKFLTDEGFTFKDLGSTSSESCHYSEFGLKAAKKISKEENSFAILLCGSGIGISIAANRISNVRAARCLSVYDAKMSRMHNNANAICIGTRVISQDEIFLMIKTFLSTEFEGGRHQTRIDLFNELGEKI